MVQVGGVVARLIKGVEKEAEREEKSLAKRQHQQQMREAAIQMKQHQQQERRDAQLVLQQQRHEQQRQQQARQQQMLQASKARYLEQQRQQGHPTPPRQQEDAPWQMDVWGQYGQYGHSGGSASGSAPAADAPPEWASMSPEWQAMQRAALVGAGEKPYARPYVPKAPKVPRVRLKLCFPKGQYPSKRAAEKFGQPGRQAPA